MIDRLLHRQARLLDRHWSALRDQHDRDIVAPAKLDAELAELATRLSNDINQLGTTSAYRAALRQQIDSRIAAQAERDRRTWAGPALDTRRQPSPPTSTTDATDDIKETVMSKATGAPGDYPVPVSQRLAREWLKIAAAILAFALVGALLVLVLRDGDSQNDTVPGVNMPATPSALSTSTTAVVAASVTPVTASPTVAALTNAQATRTAGAIAQTATVNETATANASLPSPGELVAEIPVGVRPFGIAATDNAIWVAIADEGTVARIDPATNAVVATVRIGPEGASSHAHPSDLVAYDGQVWTINNVDDTLVRIDPATNQVAQEIEVIPAAGSDDFNPFFMLVDETGIWVTELDANRLLHIDPATGSVLASLDLPRVGWMASGFGSIWVHTNQDTTDSALVRVDQVTHEIISEFSFASVEPLLAPGYVVVGAGTVWVSDFSSGTVIRIDPTTNTVVAIIDSGLDSGADMAVTENSAWIAASTGPGVVRIDLETNQPSQSLPSPVGWYLVEFDGSVWIPATGDDLVVRIDEAS